MVLSNCAVDAVSFYPTDRKPFDMFDCIARIERRQVVRPYED
jgi:hypothetical protein